MEGEDDKIERAKLSEEQAAARRLEQSKPFVAGDRKMVAHDARIHRLLRGDETEAAPVARQVEDFETKCLELSRRAIAAGWQLEHYAMLGNGNRITFRKGDCRITKFIKPEDLSGKDLDKVLAELVIG